MCGINGIFAYHDGAPPISRDELIATRDHMWRRGPDGKGEWISEDRRLGLGHRRLSIIDLSDAGSQPMPNADGSLIIVFNGEIYNYRELRSDLQQKGYIFRSHSDTEVLLHLYAEKREHMLNDIRGMYAFAIWDARDQSLFLARDPFGIKPLYLADDGKTLRFASQVKALLAGGSVPHDRSPEGEAGYWVWGHIPEPYTLYTSIRAFEPGSWLLISQGGKRTSGTAETVAGFLGLTGRGHSDFVAPSQVSLRDVLLDTVRKHLISDVPVGLFLSSGIDSAVLLALAAECGTQLNTITLGFAEFKGTPDDETPLAEQLAQQYRANHKTVWISKADFEADFEDFLKDMDQPTIDGLNTWMVCRSASRCGFKVALSGLGGDEFFGGYPSFSQIPRMRMIARPFQLIPDLGRMLRRMSSPLLARVANPKFAGLLEDGSTWDGAYMLRRAMRMPWELHPSMKHVPRSSTIAKMGTPDHLVIAELEATRYMRDQLLRDSDWASMAHSIELRVPLVDKAVTHCVGRQARNGKNYNKRNLAAAAVPSLPNAVTNRPKTGFCVPIRSWVTGDMPRAKERGLRSWQSLILARAS